ncbi:CorA metal ion transporter, partial [Cladochytrium tenue]
QLREHDLLQAPQQSSQLAAEPVLPQLSQQQQQQQEQQQQQQHRVTPDWIGYALIDDVTDALRPVLGYVEMEVDSIDDLVFILRASEQNDMLMRIGGVHKHVSRLVGLLKSKSEVLRAIVRRLSGGGGAEPYGAAAGFGFATAAAVPGFGAGGGGWYGGYNSGYNGGYNSVLSVAPAGTVPAATAAAAAAAAAAGAETARYLADIQDHVISMQQSLEHVSGLLDRAHGNYLAQISVEVAEASQRTGVVGVRITTLASIIVPLNIVTGLWGMNVKVPGRDEDSLVWFYWLVAGMVAFAAVATWVVRVYKLL